MKRIFLLIATNVAIMLVLSVVVSVLGLDRYLTREGLNLQSLLAFSAVLGFGGAFVSLLISKWMAKATMGVQDIRQLDASMPFGRVCQPEDIANAVRYLVSDLASYVTGEKINVYGGGQG